MATIVSNVFLSTGATATSAAGDDAPASGAPGDFMQLVSGMIEGNASGEQLPSSLVELLLTGDTAGLEGLDGLDSKETDTTGSDDDESEEAGALALSALLAGLQAAPAAPAAGASNGDMKGVSSLDASSSQRMMQSLLDTSQAGLTAALDGAVGDGVQDGAGFGTGVAGTGAGVGVAGDGAAGLNGAGGTSSASHVQSMLQAHRAAEATPQAASAEVRTPVGAQGWSDEIGTHLAIMAANGRETASLRLSPEHLGPLEVQISVKDGQTNVVFGASNPETRSALEQSLPRLREMFASQGLVLGDANVSRDAPRDSFKPATFANASRGSSDASSDASVKPITMTRLGLVDTYV